MYEVNRKYKATGLPTTCIKILEIINMTPVFKSQPICFENNKNNFPSQKIFDFIGILCLKILTQIFAVNKFVFLLSVINV